MVYRVNASECMGIKHTPLDDLARFYIAVNPNSYKQSLARNVNYLAVWMKKRKSRIMLCTSLFSGECSWNFTNVNCFVTIVPEQYILCSLDPRT